MNDLNNKKKEDENILLNKSGNISELLKVGRASNINLDISRLSGRGFSNLLEKAKKLQDLKKKDVKSNLEIKKEEFDSIVKKGKENIKNNNIALTKIPDNFEILRKFSLRMSNKKANNKINLTLESKDNQNSLQQDNYAGKSTIANTNSGNNSNVNSDKKKLNENTDKSINNDNKKENGKDDDDSSIDYIKKSETNTNTAKRKYFHFYKIFNNLNYKNNKNKLLIIPKLKQNKNKEILNPDSLYEYIEDTEDNNIKNDTNEENVKCDEENNSNIMNINQDITSFEYQNEPLQNSTDNISQDIDNINISLENNNNLNDSDNNSFNNNNNKKYEELNFSNEIYDMNDNFNFNKEDKSTEDNNVLNNEEADDNYNNNEDILSKAIEYETVNSCYSIKQCNTVIEYSFREDQNISYCLFMEDKSKSIENFNNNKNQMLFQIFDGFKGEEVSNFLQQNFTHIYKQYLEETKGNIPRSLVKSFKEIDEELKKISNIEGKSSTGTVIHIIWENKNKLMIYSGNVGNTRACLISPAYIIKISQDQDTPETKYKNSKLKTKNKYNQKGISIYKKNEKMHKMFGNYKLDDEENDFSHNKFYKNKYKKECIKTHENDVKEETNNYCVPYIAKMEIDLSVENQFLFMASDGIWDKIDENEIQELIFNNNGTEQLCSTIIKNALYKDTKDNMSIFAIKLT
jgi:serine/threonine protein phosphatase PrpC